MSDLEKAARMALEALEEANTELEYLNDPKGFVSMRQERIMEKARKAVTALRQALEQSIEVQSIEVIDPDSRTISVYEQPVPPPECKTDAEKTAFAFGWFKALEANREQLVQDDPCPGCRKGGVCRTPKCGRLKLPIDHPLRSQHPAPQEPVDWEAIAADQAMTIAMMKAERKPWVGLTDEERKRAIQFNNAHEALAVVIEAKLKEKNT